MDKDISAGAFIQRAQPENPVLGFRPHVAERTARWFLGNFPGSVLYAVKANDRPTILDALYRAGIRDFDVASLGEIELMSRFDGVRLHLMHPVKSRRTISQAYFDFGVRDFALDSEAELQKIIEETGGAKDLNLFVRVERNGAGAALSLGDKFGVSLADASNLLLKARHAAQRLGLTFHVGSQAMEPLRFSEALSDLDQLIIRSGVLPDIIDVGGGFPVPYPTMMPPPLEAYFDVIARSFENMCVVETCALQCQPGRALVAGGGSVIVRVEGRRGNKLYLNDGGYGVLFDAAHMGFVYPARRVFCGREETVALQEGFSFYGPTCDGHDYMPGPFMLPGDIDEGDYIEICQLGAYGAVMAGRFNGFGRYDEVVLGDEPMLGLNLDIADKVTAVGLRDGVGQ